MIFGKKQMLSYFDNNRIKRYFGFFCIIALLSNFGCTTNYSSDEQVVNPLIIVSYPDEENIIAHPIVSEGDGHLVTVAAQNQEIGFAGYRLYEEDTAAEAQNSTSGYDCGALAVLPISSTEYIIEVKPDQTTVTSGYSNRLCAIPYQLTSGRWIVMRSLITRSLVSLGTSIPSNAVQVP